MKYLYSIVLILLCASKVFAQDEFPVGSGFCGFYGITGLQNSDDKRADQRLDYKMTLGYSAGVERFSYFSNNFGWGMMLNYANINQDYTGVDTFSKNSYKMSSNMLYYKANVLMHYKSYNLYRPESRTRFVAYFGPYIGMLTSVSETSEMYASDGTFLTSTTFDGNLRKFYNSSTTYNYEKPLYKLFDIGGTLAIGFEAFMSKKRKLSVALMLRSDVGATNIENSVKQIIRDQNGNSISPNPINPWDGLYAKFWPLQAPIDPNPANPFYTRARTTTVNYSGGLSIRYYLYPERKKLTNIFIIR